ncbi:MAG: hypothetical protein ACRCXB_28380 [Aeromonadaceae bacterium]
MSVSEPSKILTPWATSGLKNTIPSAADPVTGKAGYDQGFPAINMTAKEAGGIPPLGQDFNGIFFDITQILQYMQAGGHPTYSSALSSAIGGYPLGAMLAKASGFGFWRNITANNTANPDSGGAGWVSDSPGGYVNATTITASSTALSSTQVGQAFLFTTAASTVALPAASSVAAGGAYKLHTSAGFTLSVTGGGAMQSGNASVTSLSVPAGTEVLAVSTGAAWWVFGTGQTMSSLGLVGGIRNLKASTTGTSAAVTITADQIALDSTAGAPPLLANSVSVSPSLTTSGANGLDTGTSAASTWYSVWVISNGATTAGLLSLSATAPTMPSGYTYRRRVGWVRTDATANKYLLSMTSSGNSFQYIVNGGNVPRMPAMSSGVQGNPTVPTWVPVAVSSFVPSTASKIKTVLTNPQSGSISIAAPNNKYGYSASNPPLAESSPAAAGFGLGNSVFEFILESTSVYFASNSTAATFNCVGWEDSL